jgi:hypothetical protein
MQIQTAALSLLALAASTDAFAPQPAARTNVAVQSMAGMDLPSIESEVSRRREYEACSFLFSMFLTFFNLL